jgi:hypothetical protein
MATKDVSILCGSCHCGCGQKTPIQARTCTRDGSVKGQPCKYLPNHNNRVEGRSKLDWLVDAIEKHSNSDECLLWPWSTDRTGYGQFQFEGRLARAHRVAYKLLHGEFPLPCGRHTCNIRKCCNPKHIIPGTQVQNIQDTIAANRHVKGEGVHTARLTEPDIPAIYQRYREGNVTMGALAREFQVSDTSISSVIRGTSWKHVTR